MEQHLDKTHTYMEAAIFEVAILKISTVVFRTTISRATCTALTVGWACAPMGIYP